MGRYRKFLLVLALMGVGCWLGLAEAQVKQEWVARYNGPGNSDDSASAIALDSAGNIYVTGSSGGRGTNNDYATIKYDSNGNQLWVLRYNESGDSSDFASAIVLDSAGNVYVTGGSGSYRSSTSFDYATIKYSQGVTSAPDLAISSSDISFEPGTARPGTPVTIKANIRNIGGTDASCDVSFYYDDASHLIGTVTDHAVATGQSATAQIVWNTTGREPRKYPIIVIISNANPAESNTSNNQAQTDYTFARNNPPNTPSNPSPANGATPVSINPTLSWSGGDPDAGDTVDYDIYFGTSSDPPLGKLGLTEARYSPGSLRYSTTYYWRVLAWDNHFAKAGGPIWSFTIFPTNPALIAQAGPDQVVATGNNVILDGSGSYDPDGNSLSYSWDLVSRPAGSNLALSDNSSQRNSFAPDKDGLYKFELVVNDGQAQSRPDYVTVRALGQEGKIIVATNKNQYEPGNTLQVFVWAGNISSAREVKADAFIGFGSPDGSLYFFDSALNLKPSDPTDPRTFTPFTLNAIFPRGWVFPNPQEINADSDGNGKPDSYRLFYVTLPSYLAPGTYFAFAALAEPGSVQAGSPRIVGDISIVSFSYSP